MNAGHTIERPWTPDAARQRWHPQPDAGTVIALVALIALVGVALFGGRVAPYEPIYFLVEHGSDPRPYDPGVVFPFGSDPLGRDLFSLVLAGAQATLTIVLLAGLARVLAGVLIAAAGSLWRPLGLVTETVAELVTAVPATLVALVLIRAFVKTDTSVLVLIGALLLMGWAGPYRVIRAELDRLARAPFAEGAQAIGVTRWRLLWRHQLPHLVPVIAMNLSQQIVAALVLLAELGVLGVLVGAVRSINVTESLTVVRVGPPMEALVPDAPEWGAMLASSRTIEALWTTRWLIFVPGVAFALTAIAVAAIGFGLARRYARRDIFMDRRGITVVAIALVALLVGSSFVPDRYAAAREWAGAARAAVPAAADSAAVLAGAELRAVVVTQTVPTIGHAGPAAVSIGGATVRELAARPAGPPPNAIHVQSVISADTGSGTVSAPLVFAGRGIVPSDHPPLRAYKPLPGAAALDLGSLIDQYPDDYAAIDVRGKVVLLTRFLGIDAGRAGFADGFAVDTAVTDAIRRGAAAVLFVDPFLGSYRDAAGPSASGGAANPYLTMERLVPAKRLGGPPVVVLDATAAAALVGPLGLDLAPLLGYDSRDARPTRSPARDLGITARVEVPVRVATTTASSLIGEPPDLANGTGRIVVWATRHADTAALEPARARVLAAVAQIAVARHVPFTFVDFDPHGDPAAVRAALADRRVALVLVLGDLDGSALRFQTANGDLIPAFDRYADTAGARHEVTRRTASAELMTALAPLVGVKTVVISGSGGAGDLTGDAAILLGYVAGRLALGAPELPR